jgi:hypothetical protein
LSYCSRRNTSASLWWTGTISLSSPSPLPLSLFSLLPSPSFPPTYYLCSVRPLELDNVYNQGQVHIVLREGEVLEIPDFDDIYDSDQGEEDEEEGEEFFSDEEVEGSVTGGKRRRREGESSYEARRRRHLWRRKREEILYKYGEFNYHGTAVSWHIFNIFLSCWRQTH